MDMSKKTCPYCGRGLVLVPPSREYFPHSMGLSANGVEFCTKPRLRLLSYTSDPSSHFTSECLEEKSFFESESVSSYEGHIKRRGKARFRCITTKFIRAQIDKGGLNLYKENLFFLCEKCKNKIAVNYNPWRTIVFPEYILTGAFFVLTVMFFMCIGGLLEFAVPAITLAAILGCAAVYFITVVALTKHIERNCSNFAPVDEYDSLITPSTDLVMTPEGIYRRFLHESNVFQTALCNEEFSVYLIKKRETLSFSICGVNGEPQRILSLLQEKMSAGETVTLTLSFEGKPAGSARVLEISERSKRDES